MIETKVYRTIQDFSMFKPGEKVVVGVSGGADSIALMLILNALKSKLNIHLFIAHLDHMIRGPQAKLDAKYVLALSKKLKLPCIVEEFDVPGYAKSNKMNLEEAARRIRYGFFEKIAAEVEAGRIAVGHTADDNIETFLMRLIRGSGLKGLEGIPAVRGKVVRPLMGVFRSDIEGYLRAMKIVPRIDRTNFDTKYQRNSIRHDLLPALKSFNSNIKETLLRTIYTITADQDFIEKKAGEALKSVMANNKKGDVQIDISRLSRFDRSLQAAVIRLAIEKAKNDMIDISFVHIEDILDLINKKRGQLHLPGIFVYTDKGKLRITTQKAIKPVHKPYLHELEVPGRVNAGEAGYRIDAEILDFVPSAKLHMKDPFRAYLDYDKIKRPLFVRGRKDGDVFRPLGMSGKKKLQDIYVDEKVDHDKRDNIPVIEDGRDILWIVGYRVSEIAKVTSKTRKVVKLSARSI